MAWKFSGKSRSTRRSSWPRPSGNISHHVLAGLTTHQGPILTVANWSGTWPGLVGMLNLNGSLTKANVTYSSLWSEDFKDDFFLKNLRSWLTTGTVKHDTSHVKALKKMRVPSSAAKIGREFGQRLKRDKLIMGVFDEGCMGMFNAIIPDELLHPTGVFKERLSQSSLYAKMLTVTDKEARAVYNWLLKKGMKFKLGTNEKTDLTQAQVLLQCKMYIAAVRIAAEFGAQTIGIQYQQGLKDLAPASDLVEGLLNNVDRPPVYTKSPAKCSSRARRCPTSTKSTNARGSMAWSLISCGGNSAIRPKTRCTIFAGAVSTKTRTSMPMSGCFSFPARCRPSI